MSVSHAYLEHLNEGDGKVQVDDIAEVQSKRHEQTDWHNACQVELQGDGLLGLNQPKHLHSGMQPDHPVKPQRQALHCRRADQSVSDHTEICLLQERLIIEVKNAFEEQYGLPQAKWHIGAHTLW